MSTKPSSAKSKPAATTTSNSIYSWDDQNNIGEFSVLTSECDRNKEELSTLNMELAKMKDSLLELEMILDESEPVELKIGASFISMGFEEGKEYILSKANFKEKEISAMHNMIEEQEEKMKSLKTLLYSRFGDSIQLEH